MKTLTIFILTVLFLAIAVISLSFPAELTEAEPTDQPIPLAEVTEITPNITPPVTNEQIWKDIERAELDKLEKEYEEQLNYKRNYKWLQ